MSSSNRRTVCGLKNPLCLVLPPSAGAGASRALALLPATSLSIRVRPAPAGSTSWNTMTHFGGRAQEIATTGAKVLHPRCLSPLRLPQVPLLIKDTNRPELAGTRIGPELREEAASVKAISTRKGITLVSMESVGMWQQVGFLADVFNQFKQHGLSVDLIGSAETNVTVSLDPTENLLDSDVLAALATDLAKVCRVKVIAPCAAVTMVGRGMRSMLHRLNPVMAEFGQHRVHMISQSSNNLNLTFVVDENVVDGLLPQLHEQLVRAGAMRTDDADLFGPTWERSYNAW
ncbi:MAG: hypothetical protein WDW38_011454 [Sanguina aurantia]